MGCFSTQPDQQKSDPMQKCAKNARNYQIFEKNFLALFAHSAFYKIHISGAANRHVPVKYAKYVVFFLFFFLSNHHDTNPLLHLHHFRKKLYLYNYISASINSESSRVIFSFFFFFCLHPVGQTFLYPANFVTI